MIKETINTIEAMPDLPGSYACCWLEHDKHGWHDEDFCHDCAKIAYNILISKEFYRLQRHYPLWYDCTRDNLDIVVDYSNECDNVRICVHCYNILSVVLTDYAIESELDHFECSGIDTPNDYRHFLDVLYGLEHIENGWYPGEYMTKEEVAKERNLYDRAVRLCQTYGFAGERTPNEPIPKRKESS